MTGPEMLVVAEVARAFRVHKETVRTWVRRGTIRAIKTPGGELRFHRADVEALKSASKAKWDGAAS